MILNIYLKLLPMGRLLRTAILALALLACQARVAAQCPMENTAFQAGEKLTYDLYFNWNFIWVHCGSACYTVKSDSYKGQDVLRNDLLFTTSKKCDMFFVMRDTMVNYITPDLVPLYFRKGATEGHNYTVDELWYSYPGDKTTVKQRRLNRHGEWSQKQTTSDDCIFDMLSILARARSYDTRSLRVNDRIHFPMATGKDVRQQTLVYKGKQKWKANDKKTYNCLVFSLLNDEDKKKELLRFYVTDDARHLPVRIDFNLKFGTAKAFFAKGEGLR